MQIVSDVSKTTGWVINDLDLDQTTSFETYEYPIFKM